MKLYNSLSGKPEVFKPINPPKVLMYSCGPTVYDYAHIGNFRTYMLSDILYRSLKYLGFEVKSVSNVTDVGHLVSDDDSGEDKLEKGARRENKTAWDVAKKFTDIYLEHEKKLNILPPEVRCLATKYVPQQIELVKKLEKFDLTYKTSDGIYFDSGKVKDYGALSPQDQSNLKEGARVETNPEKRNPTDFALWKFSPQGLVRRDMEWESPWGVGFPGWHLECSAMAITELGEQIDIHVGGTDLKPIHHNNEIAQSEAATGKKPFSRYWIHGEFLQVDGGKMSKSLKNFYNLDDLEKRGYEPLSLRYLYLTAHYRSFLNFTWDGLRAASQGLTNLRNLIPQWEGSDPSHFSRGRTELSEEKLDKARKFSDRFRMAIENDLQIPEALAVAWEVVKSNLPSPDKVDLIRNFDRVLGLDLLNKSKKQTTTPPPEVAELVKKRELARKNNDWKKADHLREEIQKLGWEIEDTAEGPSLRAS